MTLLRSIKPVDRPILIALGFTLVILAIGTGYTLATTGTAPLLSPGYLLQQLQSGSFLGISAAGMMMVILLGHIDLSIPWTLTAAAMIDLENPASILGRDATWVGHGLIGTGTTGAQSTFEFRASTNVIDVFGNEYGLSATSFVADFDKPDGSTNASSSSPTATRLEGNVTSGDSGGGVFITIDGKPYLAGINSYTGGFAPGTNSKYGSISGAADLQQFHSWIFDQTGITAIPEPSTWWICSLASLICLRRHR